MSCANSNGDFLAQRDTFFHACWLRLKQRRVDIWPDMDAVELDVAGWPAQDLNTAQASDVEVGPDEPIVL